MNSIDIANYVIKRVNEKGYDKLSSLRVHKIMFLILTKYAQYYNRLPCDLRVCKWRYGATIEQLYHTFKYRCYGQHISETIKSIEFIDNRIVERDFDEDMFTHIERSIFDYVIEVCYDVPIKQIIDMMLEEDAYKGVTLDYNKYYTFEEIKNSTIVDKLYKQKVESEPYMKINEQNYNIYADENMKKTVRWNYSDALLRSLNDYIMGERSLERIHRELRNIKRRFGIKYDKDIYSRALKHQELGAYDKAFDLIFMVCEEVLLELPNNPNDYWDVKGNLDRIKRYHTFDLKGHLKKVVSTHKFCKAFEYQSIEDFRLIKEQEFFKQKEKSLKFEYQTIEELRLIKEREFFKWKEKSLNKVIKFLDFNWSIHDDYIRELKLRLILSEGREFYQTPILDSKGVIHHNVRVRELEALYEHLLNEKKEVDDKIEHMWDLIQNAKEVHELPTIFT